MSEVYKRPYLVSALFSATKTSGEEIFSHQAMVTMAYSEEEAIGRQIKSFRDDPDRALQKLEWHLMSESVSEIGDDLAKDIGIFYSEKVKRLGRFLAGGTGDPE